MPQAKYLLSAIEVAVLAVVLVWAGTLIVPCHWTSIWMDREFTGWVVPISNRFAAGQVLYTEGAHTPVPPLSFVLAYWLVGPQATWLSESLLNFTFQCLTILILGLSLSLHLPRPVSLLAALATVPVFLSLEKTIAYDAMTQALVAAVGAAAAACVGRRMLDSPGAADTSTSAHEQPRGRLLEDEGGVPSMRRLPAATRASRSGSRLSRQWCPFDTAPDDGAYSGKRIGLGLLAAATAGCILCKQSTGAGAALGASAALLLFPRLQPLRVRVRHVSEYLVATTGAVALGCAAVWPFVSLTGMVVDVLLTGSEPKGGSVHLLSNVVTYGLDIAGLVLPAALTILLAATLFRLAPNGWRGTATTDEESLRPPSLSLRHNGAGNLVAAAIIGAAVGLVWAVGFDSGPRPGGLSRLLSALPAHILSTGLLACLAATGLAVWSTAVTRERPYLQPLAVYSMVWVPAALFHNLSVDYFRWTYDNNPLIMLALAAAFVLLLESLPSWSRRPGTWAMASVFVIEVAVWTTTAPITARVRSCTESWPEVAHLAGARLPKSAAGMRELVGHVRQLAPQPDDEVLLLPNDPNVEAWFERRRPPLSSAIVFVDQYWDRYVDGDFALLAEHPPAVIVIGPRRFAPLFANLWSAPGSPPRGATRLIGRVRQELLPKSYRLDTEQKIVFGGQVDIMDVYVRIAAVR